MTPTIGRIVIFKLTKEQAEQVNRRRTTGEKIADRMRNGTTQLQDCVLLSDQVWPRGAQAHIGTNVKEGDEFPMVVVRSLISNHSEPKYYVSGQALLDGNDVLWVRDSVEGTEPGQWRWPDRV